MAALGHHDVRGLDVAVNDALGVSGVEGLADLDAQFQQDLDIHGTEFDYEPDTGEVRAITRVPAGYGKVAVLDELAQKLGVVTDRIVYVGDGSSDVHVMLHVNNGDGFTIAVSENQQLARIAKATVLSDSAFSILVPVLNQVLSLRTPEIRALLESQGLMLHDWERASRTDRVKILELASPMPAPAFA